MLKNASLKSKLLFLCFGFSASLLVVGGINYYGLRRLAHEYGHVAHSNLPNVKDLADMRAEFRRMRTEVLLLGLPGLTPEAAQDAIRNAKTAMETYRRIEKDYEAVEYEPGVKWGPGEKELYDNVHAAFEAYEKLALEAISYHESGKPGDHEKMLGLFLKECKEALGVYVAASAKLFTYQIDESKVWVGRAESTETSVTRIALLTIFFSTCGGLAIGFSFARNISRTLSGISNTLSNSAKNVAAASQQVSSSSEELSASATEQAASLQETSSSVEEMTAMINKNAENAVQSQAVSTSSQKAAERGKDAVSNMLRAMDEISTSNAEIMRQIDESNKNIADIVKVISEIGNKTKVINDIVFQTKLLSFNASVEAARAGEHGKGFAVVAEEVGNLAAMSGTAAKEISTMLEGSIKKVETIVADTKSKVERLAQVGREKVTAGTDVAKTCQVALEEMVSSVTDVSRMVSEIATASQEQATGVKQINQAIGQLDQATQQNATASQQTASAAEQLSSLAVNLHSLVLDLERTVEGSAGAVAIKPLAKTVSRPVYEPAVRETPKPSVEPVLSLIHI